MTYKVVHKLDEKKAYLGTGLSFPLHLDSAQRFKLVSSEEDIRQSIFIILGTMPGERVMRPEFGCRAHELLFAPYDTATASLLIYYVEEALRRWEPRIELQEVVVENDRAESRVIATIYYTIKATHDERSIVYPFYLLTEEL